MSWVCAAAITCPFKPEQTTAGCPNAEHCPYLVEDAKYSTTTVGVPNKRAQWHSPAYYIVNGEETEK